MKNLTTLKVLIIGIVITFITLPASISYAQHTWTVNDIPMFWRHFTKKNINVRSNAVALTNVKLQMESEVVSNGEDHKLMILITIDQSKKDSWVSTQFLRRATDQESIHVLHHERLHLAINYISFMKLHDTLQAYNFTRNYKAELASIFQKIQAENNILNREYDRFTTHSINIDAQQEWETKIMTLFNEYYHDYNTLPSEMYIQKTLPPDIRK